MSKEQRQGGIGIESNSAKLTPQTVFDRSEGLRLSFKDVSVQIKNETVDWGDVSQTIKRELLVAATNEHGLLPPQLSRSLLSQSFTFLDGQNLSGLYEYTRQEVEKEEPQPNKDIILTMLQETEVPVVLPTKQPKRKVRVTTLPEDVELEKFRFNHPILTREQEQKLFRYLYYGIPLAYLDRDRDFLESFGEEEGSDSRNIRRIIEQSDTISEVIAGCNQRFVSVIVKSYNGGSLDYTEKLAVGNTGLLRAIEKFDPTRGKAKFAGYAKYWIKHKLQRATVKEGYGIAIPAGVMVDRGRLLWVRDAFFALFNREPTRDELRQQAIVHLYPEPLATVARIEKALDVIDQVNHVVTSLNKGLAFDTKTKVGDTLISDAVGTAESGIDNVTREQIKVRLDALLSEQEQLIIYYMYDFQTGETKNIAEVAAELSISSEIVMDLFNSAFGKLKKDEQLHGIVTEAIEAGTQDKESIGAEDVFADLPFNKEVHIFVGEERVSLKRALQEAGIPHQQLTTYVEIAVRRRRGESIRKIAEALGLASKLVTNSYYKKLRELKLIEMKEMVSAVDQEEEVRTLTQQGLSTNEVAEQLHLAESTVKKYCMALRRKGLLPPVGVIDKSTLISEATEAVGSYLLSHPRVSYKESFRKIFGPEGRTRSKKQKLDMQVKDLRNKNLMDKEIAELLGVSVDKVKRSVQRLITQGEMQPRRSKKQ